MRYLILTPTGRPIDEHDDVEEAREAIAGTNNTIQYIMESDDERAYPITRGSSTEQVFH